MFHTRKAGQRSAAGLSLLLSIVLASALLLRSQSAGGEEAPTPTSDSSAPIASPDTDGGSSAPASTLPTPPVGYMLVPIHVDGGAVGTTPDAGVSGEPSIRDQRAAAYASADFARFRYADTWDLNLEGGGGYVFGDVDKWSGFFRARPGLLFVRNDSFYQVGPTIEYLGISKRPAFGAQVEYLHLQMGAWVQLGGSIDTKGRPGPNAALGLSLFGVEAQIRELDGASDPAFALLGKVRLPLGILVYGLRTKK